MPALPPALLTLPASGDRTLARLQRKLRLLAVRELLAVPARALPPSHGPALGALQRSLGEALRQDPEPTLEAVGSPDVLPGLLAVASRAWPTFEALRAAVPPLLTALERSAEAVLWPGPVPWLLRPDGALARWARPASAVLLDGSGLAVEVDGERIDGPELPWQAQLALGPGVFSTVDSNPLAAVEAHPDKSGNAIDLGGRGPEAWAGALGRALEVVAQALPEWSPLAPVTLRRVLPVGYLPEVHLSASYREAPGRVYLTLHPSTLTLAEALVHEGQHGALNVTSWLDPVLRNGRTTWTPSPVRPDLRPLMGVLLAVHAFVPVAAMHWRLAEAGHPLAAGPDFIRRRAQVLAGNDRGLAILEELADPTPLGVRLLSDLRRLHEACLDAAPPLGEEHARALPPG